MGVVFDEVTGSVEPETKSATEQSNKPPATDENEFKLRHLLCKLEQRESRLLAD